MTSENPIQYATPVPNTATKGFSSIYRPCDHEALTTNCIEQFDNTWQFFEFVANKFEKNAFLGTRVKYEDGTFGPYVWKTYGQIYDLAIKAGRGLSSKNYAKNQNFVECHFQQNFKFVGIYSKNREEWNIIDYACAAFGMTLVPLYDTLGDSALNLILNKTRMSVIVANYECTMKLLNMNEEFKHLQYIITLDNVVMTETQRKTHPKIRLITWQKLIEIGSKEVNHTTITGPTIDSANTISFTSGTTGEPKGAIITHKNLLSFVGGMASTFLHTAKLTSEDVTISYLPLAHIYERIVELLFAYRGARIGFYGGEILKITEDLQELCPTIFITVPRLINRIFDKISSNMQKKSKILQKLFYYALNTKINNIQHTHKHFIYDHLLFGRIKGILGGNCRIIISGSAPLSNSLQKTMKAMFCAPFIQGYGLTETMGASFVANIEDPQVGHVGGPNGAIEYRIKTVEEMNYYADTYPPRGELLLRGPSVAVGYFLNDEANNESYDSEGWFYTGDVVEIGDNGCVSIIDRRKNIFKLAQGEYLIPEKIEGILVRSMYVEQIYLTGLSTESYAVAIVVPNEEVAKEWAMKNEIGISNFAEICQNNNFNKEITQDLRIVGREGGLVGFEIPKFVFLFSNLFSVENEFLTPSFKLRRPQLSSFFKEEITKMYEQQAMIY